MEHAGPQSLSPDSLESAAQTHCHDLFASFLKEDNNHEEDALLSDLIAAHLGPLAKTIIHRKLRFASSHSRASDDNHLEDVYQDVVVHLLTQLKAFKAAPLETPINDLESYVAVIAYRACYNYLRRKYPQRHGLKNKIRYLLTRNEEFEVWQSGGKETLAGFVAWKNLDASPRARERLESLHTEARGSLPARALSVECAERRPADLLTAIFDHTGGPVELDELVNVIASIWGVKDQEEAPEILDRLPDGGSEISQRVEHRELLSSLWREIVELPAGQRSALLLNMRDADGNSSVALFPLIGIASLRQIAEVLEMTAEQLTGIWRQMPLDDLTIGEKLSLSRQQVINLRKSARARLARRVRHLL